LVPKAAFLKPALISRQAAVAAKLADSEWRVESFSEIQKV
jgi:hypothetical protein